MHVCAANECCTAEGESGRLNLNGATTDKSFSICASMQPCSHTAWFVCRQFIGAVLCWEVRSDE